MHISGHICYVRLISMVWLCTDNKGIFGISALNLGILAYSVLPPYTGRRQEILLLILKCGSCIVAIANNHSINCHKAFRRAEPLSPMTHQLKGALY